MKTLKMLPQEMISPNYLKDGIQVGETAPKDIIDGVDVIMRRNIKLCAIFNDGLQLSTIQPSFTAIEENRAKERFCTFEEYQKLFDKHHYKDESFENLRLHYPILKLLKIKNEEERQHYISRYSNDLEGYFEVMKEVNLDLARFFFTSFQPTISEDDRKSHTYIVGQTGSGKSELMKTIIHESIIKNNSAVIVIDPKGDLANQIAQWEIFKEKPHRERLVYFDPYLLPFYSPVINPFQLFKNVPADKVEQVIEVMTNELSEIFDTILTEADSSGNITTQMKLLLRPCIATILRKNYKTGKGDILDLKRFMDDKNNKDLVEFGLQTPNKIHHQTLTDYYNKDYNVSKHGINTRLGTILDSTPLLNILTGKTTIDLQQLTDEKKVIVFALKKGDVGTEVASRFGKILISLIQVIGQLRTSVFPERVPTYIFIDEFQNYITERIKTILAECRGMGLHLTVAQQLVGQEMSTAFERLVMGNTNVKIVGKSSDENYKDMGKEMRMKTIDYDVLNTGKYFVRIGNGYPFVLRNKTKFLDWSYSMYPEIWQEVIEQQRKQYYKRLSRNVFSLDKHDTPPPPPPPNREDDNLKFKYSDF
jgi:hypothetical protein